MSTRIELQWQTQRAAGPQALRARAATGALVGALGLASVLFAVFLQAAPAGAFHGGGPASATVTVLPPARDSASTAPVGPTCPVTVTQLNADASVGPSAPAAPCPTNADATPYAWLLRTAPSSPGAAGVGQTVAVTVLPPTTQKH